MSDQNVASRRRGGRAETPNDFPEDDEGIRAMTPAERIAAVQRLSRRVFAIKIGQDVVEQRHQGLPNRLVGGRR